VQAVGCGLLKFVVKCIFVVTYSSLLPLHAV